MSNPPRRAAFKLKVLAHADHATLLFVGAQALAQQAPDAKLERIEVTGSNIKRIAGKTTLPVQIFKREDIDKIGATTAAELLCCISASNAPLADGASITDGSSGQRGFSNANLRGIGVSSTLILLNGRRLANFASPGDNAGVALNSIRAGAIQRVKMSATVANTQEGGAGKRTTTLSGGFSDLAEDKFNTFGLLDVQHLDSVRSSQSQFIQHRPQASKIGLVGRTTFHLADDHPLYGEIVQTEADTRYALSPNPQHPQPAHQRAAIRLLRRPLGKRLQADRRRQSDQPGRGERPPAAGDHHRRGPYG